MVFLIGISGGILAGIGLSQGGVIFVFLSLALLWEAKTNPLAGSLWGFVALLISHRWLLALHPLNWLGISENLSFPIALLIWSGCGLLGAFLVGFWCLIGKLPFFVKGSEISKRHQFLAAFSLSLIWGLAEVLLAKGPLFWFGLGGSLLPDDRWLAGLARWIGAGGLASLQLLIGWWLWKMFLALKKGLPWLRLFAIGCLAISFAHILGWGLLVSYDDFSTAKRVALWQPNIPIRKKFSREQLDNLPIALQSSLDKALEAKADLMVAPEGTLFADQELLKEAPIDLLSGGFRWVENKQRSSVLVFNQGDISHINAIDKYRLVPLGEWMPSFPGFSFKGLSFVGNLEPGEASRLLKWEGSPLAVAICYEITDGSAIAKATLNGAKWILSISNLDPYPIALQRQFLALAQLRSIESGRELISVGNTGPSSLVLRSGKVQQVLNPFQEGVGITEVHFSRKISGYVRWGEMPLIISLCFSLFVVFVKNKNLIRD